MKSEVSKLNPSVKKVLHVISVVGSFMLVYGIVYLVQKYTIGFIPPIRKTLLFDVVPLELFIFPVTSLIFIKKFIKISSPYKD